MSPGQTLKIAGTLISFTTHDMFFSSLIKRDYKPFITDKKPKNESVILLKELAADTGTKNLKISINGRGVKISRRDFLSVSDGNFSKSTLFCSKNKFSFNSYLRVYLTLRLLKSGALLLHSGSAVLNKKAYLFPGRSGKGKSTLIKKLGLNSALSDEISVIFKKGGKYYSASTPFWGELKKGTAKPLSAPLKAIYFISHSKSLSKKKIAKPDALKKLLKTVLFFSKDKNTVSDLLALCEKIAYIVPCYSLKFAKSSDKKSILRILSK